ncbi:MAG: hypothetical protein JO357_11355 [Hyphomicrobiales bacterium]|nr:hypothetical protein [Hyphomicrobiales bacterium]MBV8767756.1 hypothetical protein [Hyphomicrobiales bacterium]MBV9052990.1 hypothetical protein [Hyphomicrobiales bacterium]MBV9137643.1 hypothetical protein [Hyphomicrobiales bacterium]MBV9589314.1 hypothetical protein [Hyphomicrobiales bacterium]
MPQKPAETLKLTRSIELDVEAVIALCEGDPRKAVRSLIALVAVLNQELERSRRNVSRGYVRKRLASKR